MFNHCVLDRKLQIPALPHNLLLCRAMRLPQDQRYIKPQPQLGPPNPLRLALAGLTKKACAPLGRWCVFGQVSPIPRLFLSAAFQLLWTSASSQISGKGQHHVDSESVTWSNVKFCKWQQEALIIERTTEEKGNKQHVHTFSKVNPWFPVVLSINLLTVVP